MVKNLPKETREDLNAATISGEIGSHPVGTGIGGASGAAIGAVVGGSAGKAVAEKFDPTVE